MWYLILAAVKHVRINLGHFFSLCDSNFAVLFLQILQKITYRPAFACSFARTTRTHCCVRQDWWRTSVRQSTSTLAVLRASPSAATTGPSSRTSGTCSTTWVRALLGCQPSRNGRETPGIELKSPASRPTVPGR